MANFDDWAQASPIADLLIRSARQYPDRDAIVFPTERRTFAQLLDGALEVARGLVALGVNHGDHVGLLGSNSVHFVEGLFGILLCGGVAVPLNARHRTAELAFIIENAQLVALLTTGEPGDYVDFADLLQQALPSLAGQSDGAHLSLAEAQHLRSLVLLRGGGRAGFLSRDQFNELAQKIDPAVINARRQAVSICDTGVIIYTSGTTANPKGCMLSHEAMTRGPLERSLTRFAGRQDHVHWIPGPLFHIGSLAPFIGAVGAGATTLTDIYFDAGRALQLMEREKVTVAWPWFPAMIQALFELPEFDPRRLASLRALLLIGNRTLVDRIRGYFPDIEILQACGMTEMAGIFALSWPSEDDFERGTTHGKPTPGVGARVVDIDSGEDAAPDTVGELLLRGYCLMQGYFNDPEKTAAAFDAGGWMRTGDLYSINARGGLTFQGRLKDMLKVGGENVATIEIEAFLCEHPAVRLAEVVGMPDPRLDEVPVAFIELRPDTSAEPKELIDFCKGRIASFKVPRAIYFVEPGDWPMSATKIDKRALRRRLPETVS